jgi:hypothetical protein
LGRFSALVVLAAAATAANPAQGQTVPVAYVQATVVEPNAAAASLAYVTASGQSRMARARGRALASLPNLRPGDEVILTLEGALDRPVVTSVTVSRVVPAPPPAETVAGPYAWTQTVPSRPSWPNPYSRINPGLPLRPAPRAATRGGTLTVMPAALRGAPAPAQPVAAPAVLTPSTASSAIAVPAAPPAAVAPVRGDSSTVDGLRARGARDFEAAVTRLAADSRTVDATWARYKASCPKAAAADDGSREWFAVWEGVAVSDADPSCTSLLDEVQRLGAPIKAGMSAAHEAARRAWVLPGSMRDIRRRHAMEWSGWDH